MKAVEIKALTIQELRDRLVSEQEMLTKLKLNHSVSPLDNPLKIRYARKDIARLKTELRKREINQENAK